MTFRANSPAAQTVITDREFENLLQRTSAIFKARQSRLLKFPGKSQQKRVGSSGSR